MSNTRKETFILASKTSREQMIDIMSKTIESYNLDPSNENWEKIGFCAAMIATKQTMKNENDPKEAVALAERYDKVKQAADFFKIDGNTKHSN